MIDEIFEMLHPETLPLSRDGRRVHYEGSIDKEGANADWDWHLYKDDRGEWVLFEQYGAGCIYNFVQHRFIDSPAPTFRFYFDGEAEPRFTLTPLEFGEKYPFITPLADKFIGPKAEDGHPIRVVRSFVPMPFTTHCKVTCDTYLEGCLCPNGGWGHIIYHTYSSDMPAKSFDPEDERYRRLAQAWSECGRPLLSATRPDTFTRSFSLNPDSEKNIFTDKNSGCVTSLRLQTDTYNSEDLSDLWVRMVWDGHENFDVFLPLGCLCGNELGHHATRYRFMGLDADGNYYFHLPMPYKTGAEISIINRGSRKIDVTFARVSVSDEYTTLHEKCGYLKATPYYPKKNTHGADSVIADIGGICGHVISSTVTGYPFEGVGTANCEGDARIHFDGIRTPSIESDGSESYSCYGWGFCSPPQTNPVSGYDGKEFDIHADWSMTRTLPGEVYPFYNRLHFAFESFGNNDKDMYHSGAVLYYGFDYSQLELLCTLAGDGEELSAYFEGDDDHIEVTMKRLSLPCMLDLGEVQADELILRRVSDQKTPCQRATVSVNGKMCEKPWYFPDSNPYKRWLEDEYIIPKSAWNGKPVKITITPENDAFNAYSIQVYKEKYKG